MITGYNITPGDGVYVDKGKLISRCSLPQSHMDYFSSLASVNAFEIEYLDILNFRDEYKEAKAV